MNWLMSSHPLVLGAWIVAAIGAVLLALGRRGKLVSRAEFCRKCGHETTSAGTRCPECGAKIGISSLRLAFELNHPLFARMTSVTRRGRRAPNSQLIAWGLLALFCGLGIGGGTPLLRLAKVDWNRFRATEVLIQDVSRLSFENPASVRMMGVLKERNDLGKLSAPQRAAYQRIALAREQFEIARALARAEEAARQPIFAAYVPPIRTGPSSASSPTPPRDQSDPAGFGGSVEAFVASRMERDDRSASTNYMPPPLTTGYAALGDSQERAASSIAELRASAGPLEFLDPANLAQSTAFGRMSDNAPRINPAFGLAPRGGLVSRPSTHLNTGITQALPSASLGFSPTFGGGSLQPGMFRTSTFNNPAIAPSSLPNRPLTPARISNVFGR